MKKNLKRAMALSLAAIATAAMPMSNVFAATEGAITASFTIDSPTLTVTVPTAVQLHVNPTFAKNSTAVAGLTGVGDYKKLPIYSDPVKISNATMSKDATAGVPVVATLYATLKPKAGAVKVAYDEADVDVNGGEKNVFVKLVGEAYLKKTDGAAASSTGDIFDLVGNGTGETYPAAAGATATPAGGGGGGAVVATPYGSMMQIAIPGPGVGAAGSGESKPVYGGFALAGIANVAADWADDDLGVDLYYRVKATNTAYDADDALAIAKATDPKLELAADQTAAHGTFGTQYKMVSAIKAAEGLSANPTNAVTDNAGTLQISKDQTNDAYFVIGDVDPTLTVTKVGFNFTDASGNNMDYTLDPAEFKSGNLYCKDDAASGAKDRILYINYLKTATSRALMSDIAKAVAGPSTPITTKFFIALSDGSVYLQDVNFEGKA